jgi:hypothetical protein
MIFEVTFWIALILASRAIAKIYYRRRDVLYGPYRATTRFRRPTTGVVKNSINGIPRPVAGIEHLRAPVRPDVTLGRVRRRVSG